MRSREVCQTRASLRCSLCDVARQAQAPRHQVKDEVLVAPILRVHWVSAITIAFILSHVTAATADWPQAAGPNGSFVVAQGNAAATWSVTLDGNIAWKKTLPELGQSSVVISGDRIFFAANKPVTASTQFGTDIIAWCCDASDGRTLWTREIKGRYPLKIASSWGDSSGVGSVTDGTRVAFFNGSGAIECFDFAGNKLWRREAISSYRGTPFLIGDKLIYIQMNWAPTNGGYPSPKRELPRSEWTQAQAISIKTGEPIWSTTCGGNIGSQPLPIKLDDGRDAFLVGRGGGHNPPEKPLGVSLVDAADGSEIWNLPIDGYHCRQTKPVHDNHALIIAGDEHWWVDLKSGKVVRRVSLLRDVVVTRKQDDDWISETTTLEKHRKAQHTDQSNLLVGDYHFFRSYHYNYLGRINVKTGRVEYLQLPTSMLREPGRPDRYIWNAEDMPGPIEKTFNVPTVPSYWNFRTNRMVSESGFELQGDARSLGNGWGHYAAPIPTAVGKHLYVPIMNGMTYTIDWQLETFNRRALISINDLGPLGESWTRSSITFSNRRLFAQTIRSLVCIEDTK